MASSVGINAVTGKVMTDWPHTEQSIRKILTTPKFARVMRRLFGSRTRDFVDLKMSRRNILALYSDAAKAILQWEPRFRMTSGKVSLASATGEISLDIYGTYYPRGHRGDYTVSESRSVRVVYPSS